MAVQMTTTEVETDLRLRIARGDAGSLGDGAQQLLEETDAVERVERVDIDGMRPDAFDLYVDATARLVLADGADIEAVRDGFGVERAALPGES
ncbi:MAG: hypothetical protein U5K28_06210 [Halobacteriales archaeon]|nr:hypothetical protein [Halobacteriales archaeon]